MKILNSLVTPLKKEKNVTTSPSLLYWDRTDRYVTTNRPDIVLVDRSVRLAIIVDITILNDDNLVKAEKEKVTKYLDLAHEITAMWVVESTVIVPIVVLVNGLLANSFDQHLKKLSLGCWIKGRVQKAVVLETARIVRRFLTLEPRPPVAWTVVTTGGGEAENMPNYTKRSFNLDICQAKIRHVLFVFDAVNL
ncbi:jg10379 [Pararge aegeria aegeria]|uniref:Jg10379 protein n=1 Tax=Pararge aegeria aegeria TaxID=348720 RepID=A0A8S4S6D1_9NEOP|nr:jg10379 [Pararge aegeria aegeria]